MMIAPRARGALLIAAATLCWSSGGILSRLIGTDDWTMVFWRALFTTMTLAAWLVARQGRGALGAMRAAGWAGMLSGLLQGASSVLYILSITRTEVANTLVLLSTAPLFAAVLGRLVLGERLNWRTLAATTMALFGIAVMVAGGLGSGGLWGNLFAVASALCFAANIVMLRKYSGVDMVPAVLLSAVFGVLTALPFTTLTPALPDLALLAVMGSVQLGVGLLFFVAGAPRLRSAEVGLLCLLEVVLAPIWVWIWIGEAPPPATLTGGLIVLAAMMANAVLSARPAGPKTEAKAATALCRAASPVL